METGLGRWNVGLKRDVSTSHFPMTSAKIKLVRQILSHAQEKTQRGNLVHGVR